MGGARCLLAGPTGSKAGDHVPPVSRDRHAASEAKTSCRIELIPRETAQNTRHEDPVTVQFPAPENQPETKGGGGRG